jgi:uncharacterized protein (DUF2237 family)
MTKVKAINILGTELQSCSTDPMTGFFRDGCCNTNHLDQGTHVICSQVTDEFLQFSRNQGNDLVTPHLEYNFPGLKAGDCWCLCATRWKEAFEAGVAPPVIAESTHQKATEVVDINILKQYALQ